MQVFNEILRHAPDATIAYLTEKKQLLTKLFAWCACTVLLGDLTHCNSGSAGVHTYKEAKDEFGVIHV